MLVARLRFHHQHHLQCYLSKKKINKRKHCISIPGAGVTTSPTEVLKEEVRILKLKMEMFLRREGEPVLHNYVVKTQNVLRKIISFFLSFC